MGLNISKGNMYDFITHTWNVVKGRCSHDCTYCYMKRWGELKPIRFDEGELNTDLGKDNFIFVGSSCDMFANDIPFEWIIQILEYCSEYDNKYLFQSKNPIDFIRFRQKMPEKTVLCTTIETNRWYGDIMKNAPLPVKRVSAMADIEHDKYVTIEPIMDFDLDMMVSFIRRCNPKQVNIGADSGNNNLPEPEADKVLALIEELQEFTIINKKNNLKCLKNWIHA